MEPYRHIINIWVIKKWHKDFPVYNILYSIIALRFPPIRNRRKRWLFQSPAITIHPPHFCILNGLPYDDMYLFWLFRATTSI